MFVRKNNKSSIRITREKDRQKIGKTRKTLVGDFGILMHGFGRCCYDLHLLPTTAGTVIWIIYTSQARERRERFHRVFRECGKQGTRNHTTYFSKEYTNVRNVRSIIVRIHFSNTTPAWIGSRSRINSRLKNHSAERNLCLNSSCFIILILCKQRGCFGAGRSATNQTSCCVIRKSTAFAHKENIFAFVKLRCVVIHSS